MVQLVKIDDLSCGDQDTENKIIHGDNLAILEFLAANKQKPANFIYIDPPYNCDSYITKYKDKFTSEEWLSFMKQRIHKLYDLLRDDGIFCCHINDTEGAYLKVMLDKIFGRKNYLTHLYFKMRSEEKTTNMMSKFQKVIEYCLVYAKDKNKMQVYLDQEPYKITPFQWIVHERTSGRREKICGRDVQIFKSGEFFFEKAEPHYSNLRKYNLTGGVKKSNANSRFMKKHIIPRIASDGYGCLYKVFGLGKDGLGYRYMSASSDKKIRLVAYSGVPLKRIDDVIAGGAMQNIPMKNFYNFEKEVALCSQNEGGSGFGSGQKPEELIELLIKHFSKEGDLVLDAFGGSGTTAAVSQKMNREWIIIEENSQIETYIQPRLKNTIEEKDIFSNKSSGFAFYRVPQ